MILEQYMAETGLSEAEISKLLRDGRLQRKSPVATSEVKRYLGKEIPKSWAEALGVPPDGVAFPTPDVDSNADANIPGPSVRAEESRPRQPADAKLAPVPGDVQQIARERIAGLYGMLGEGVGAATRNPGIPAVVQDQADPIAAAWVKAAAENGFARRFVQLMSAGGSTGELVIAHVVLVAGILYVTGGPDIGLFGKYEQYRPPGADERERQRQAERIQRAQGNGATADDSENPVEPARSAPDG